jgi:hypothetical protein
VSVKVCVAGEPTPLEAVNVRLYVPPELAAGVPLNTPVDALKVTPVGNAPDSLRVAAGNPLAVTVKLPALPTVNVALLTLVIAGAWLTVRVKLCVAGEPTPLEAVIVRLYVPSEPAAGVPLNTPVDALKVTPAGKVPDSLRASAGNPLAVTVKLPALPTVNVALLTLVIAGDW